MNEEPRPGLAASAGPPTTTTGRLVIVLHAHLPFVRHPEHERFLEESWLFEAVAECYLRLAELLEQWWRDGVPARLTLSVSPTLLHMWQDPLLKQRCGRYLRERVQLAEQECRRTHWLPAEHHLAEYYAERYRAHWQRWQEPGFSLVEAFRLAQERGLLELMTTAATHAVLPLLEAEPESRAAQIEVGCATHTRAFGRPAQGFWLPECAWHAVVGPDLLRAGVRWCIIDTHGLLHAQPPSPAGVFGPVQDPRGLIFFGRDPACARQVWSRHEGYPGDPRYRDFYRDIGWDLAFDYVQPFLPSPDHRGFTGIKYHRIAEQHGEKELYNPMAAQEAVQAQSAHWVEHLVARAKRAGASAWGSPILVAPYDAELFGHWWFEGPDFLDAVVRRVTSECGSLRLATPSECLSADAPLPVVEPAASSWGDGGYFGVWLAKENHWMVPELRTAADGLRRAMREHAGGGDGRERVLRQAVRELLLAQSSDWPFMLYHRTGGNYAEHRMRAHVAALSRLLQTLASDSPDEPWLSELEARDNVFPFLDWRLWSARAGLTRSG